jgi:hypothetical protein
MVETCDYLLGCLLIGYATVALLYPLQSISWPLAMGLSILVGCCEVALFFFYMGLAGVRPNHGMLFVVEAAALVVIAGLYQAGRQLVPRWPTDWKRNHGWGYYLWYLFPLVLGGYVGFTALRIATSTPLIGWDAWAIWLYKAKLLAAENLVPPPWVFTSPSGFGHPHYPLLWPMLAAGAYGITGTADDHYARLILIFLWIGWGLMTYSALRWKLPRLPAAMLASLQLSLPLVTEYASNGYADVVLAGFYGGMICLILRLRDSADWSVLISAALLGAGAAFTKHEGMPLACFGAALVLAMAARHGRAKAALMAAAFVGIVVILLSPWYVWSQHFPRTDEDYGSHISEFFNGANVQRLHVIIPAVGRELMKWDDWGPLWALFLIIAVLGWRAFHYSYIRALWALLAAHFLLYMFVYVITPRDINWLISTTLNRLIIHITPVAILLIGYHWSALCAYDVPEDQTL